MTIYWKEEREIKTVYGYTGMKDKNETVTDFSLATRP